MVLVTTPVPNLIQGVSQQPDSLRLPTQAAAQVNAYPSIVDGLQKRHPTEHIVKAVNGDAGLTKVHVINRDAVERYVVLLRAGDIKVFDTAGVSVPVKGPTGPFPYTPDFSYLAATDPAEFRALTVADFTFVVNRTKVAAMTGSLSAATASTRKAFIFVERGAYKSNYRVAMQLSGGNWRTAVVSTFDGTAAVNGQEYHSLTILTTGAVASTWSVTVNGVGVNYVVLGGDTITTIATALRTLIGAVAGVSVWGSGNGISVMSDASNIDIGVLNLANSGGGTFNATQERAHNVLEYPSIKTDLIAGELAQLLGGIPNVSAQASGSVVRITTTADITALDIQDSAGDLLINKIWKSVPSITDLPLTCEDGYIVPIRGETVDPGDDYYAKFVADAGAAFGTGHWEETIGPAVKFHFDNTTMPWQLVRKQDDGGGTVTGTPNAKYFEWAPVAWIDRQFGDESTNPTPSFIGKTINDFTFWKNRLGFLADQNIVLSEAGRYFNFWRTTVTTLLDSDPIDVAAAHVTVSNLHAAVPFDDRLILFSDRTQFSLGGDPLLTPRTASITPILEFENQRSVRPVSTARGLFFAHTRGQFSGMHEMFPMSNVDKYDSEEITASVPRYISGKAIEFAVSTVEDILMVLGDGNRSIIYLYKYFWSDQSKLQSAWCSYDFGPHSIVRGFDFIDNTLYIVVQRSVGLFIEKMTIAPGQTDPNATYITYLDRRISDTQLVSRVYDITTNLTHIVIPYRVEDDVVAQVVTRSTAPDNGGNIVPMVSASGTDIYLVGDHSTDALWIGQVYTMRYTFSKPSLRAQTSDRGRMLVTNGRFQLRFGSLIYDRSAGFTVKVTPLNRDTYEYPFGRALGSGNDLIGQVAFESGTFRFGLLAKSDEVTIVIENDTPLPSNLQGAEWEGTYFTKSTRYSG